MKRDLKYNGIELSIVLQLHSLRTSYTMRCRHKNYLPCTECYREQECKSRRRWQARFSFTHLTTVFFFLFVVVVLFVFWCRVLHFERVGITGNSHTIATIATIKNKNVTSETMPNCLAKVIKYSKTKWWIYMYLLLEGVSRQMLFDKFTYAILSSNKK